MPPAPVLLLSRAQVASLLPLDEVIDAVERAFVLAAKGRALPSGVLGIHARDGGFHVKAAGLELERTYFAAKVNANFPRNPERRHLPSIQGILILADAESGTPLAVMDAIEITALRTAAATAVAARHLARADASVATIVGCGVQGRYQLRALSRVRTLGRGFALDADPGRAATFARELSSELGIAIEASTDLSRALGASDLAVTCTPARAPFVRRADLPPGIFLAAVGADSEEKQELFPDVFVGTTVVADVLDQCAAFGDLHHALASGVTSRAAVHAELAQVVSGARPGRTRTDEITLFDSTGTALEDVAAAALAYEKARRAGIGVEAAIS